MAPQKEQDLPSRIDNEFQQAEQMINQTIAKMEPETHIEYGSTMVRKGTPNKWSQWLNRFLRLRNRPRDIHFLNEE